jgi:hypothetical protein
VRRRSFFNPISSDFTQTGPAREKRPGLRLDYSLADVRRTGPAGTQSFSICNGCFMQAGSIDSVSNQYLFLLRLGRLVENFFCLKFL